MAGKVKKDYLSYKRFINGIADYEKEGVEDSVAFARNVDLRSDPRGITLLPRTVKESGSVVVDLPKWGDRVDNDVYIYGDSGHIYKRTLSQTYTDIRQAPSSHGNGLGYYAEDDFMYYTSDKLLGRYGPMDNDNESATFTDDFLGSEGGIPTNTHSADLEASSSQYFTRADGAAVSITGDLTMEIYAKFESLPSVGNEMVLMSKWNGNSDERSYKMSVYASAGDYGDGSDGALTISANTTQAPTDSACSGTSGAYTLSATNASFAAGQRIMIIQMRGTGAGTRQFASIVSYTAGTITLDAPLNFSYSSTGAQKAQVIVLKQYTNVTVNAGFTWTAKAWDGTVGGILAFMANGTFTYAGAVTAASKGFLNASAATSNNSAKQGEGTGGAGGTVSLSANGNGGGGGYADAVGSGSGAGGGHAAAGTNGSTNSGRTALGGTVSGAADLTTLTMGGAGGGGGAGQAGGSGSATGGVGGLGGGLIVAIANTITQSGSGTMSVNGGAGGNGSGTGNASGGGGGAAGSVYMRCDTATLGTNSITAAGGAGGAKGTSGPHASAEPGAAGAAGRIHVDYYTSISVTSNTPSVNSTQDDTLAGTLTYQLRLYISSSGSNSEVLRTNLTSLVVAEWHRYGVSWDASASLATFYVDAVPYATATGTLTAIYDGTALLAFGADFDDSGNARSFFDGKIDDARLWNDIRTDDEMFLNKDREVQSGTANLVIYPQFDNGVTDSSGNALTLTAVNTPTYSTDVPFSAPTSRLDLDQSLDTSGNTFTLATTIAETSSDYQEFVPAKDPQKSIQVLIAAVGTGDWTITVHDSLNRTVATKTVANGSLNTGDFEFVFDEAWRPVIGATYHFHLTSTVADGTVTTTTASNLNTADFHTYYQFLVTDTAWHPIKHFLNMLAIGNERYLATWDASTYTPHRLTLPAGYRVRSLGFWNEYLAIGTMQGTNIYDHEIGRVFFWDGVSTTYNFYIDVPEGAVNALFGSSGVLHIIAGYQGDHLEYHGGSKAVKVKRVPRLDGDEYMEVYPGALTMYRTLLHYGAAGSSDATNMQRGVYSWGSRNRMYADAQTLDHTISTGRYDSNVSIGMVFPVAGDLLIGWKDNVSYGVDVVDQAASVYPSGTVEFPIHDYGHVWKEKDAQTVRGDHVALETGHSLAVKYKLDRQAQWTEMSSPHSYSASEDTNKAQKTRLSLRGGRHKEVQLALDMATTVTTSPKVLSVGLEYSPLSEEEQF